MSVFLSRKYLKYREALAIGEIDRDLACRACGYNLTENVSGVLVDTSSPPVARPRLSGICPECGTGFEK